MIYYLDESLGDSMNAGSKARNDIINILRVSSGIGITILNGKMQNGCGKHWKNAIAYTREFERLLLEKSQITCVIQFPLPREQDTMFMWSIVRRFQKKGIHFVLLIHDLESIRLSRKKDLSLKSRVLCFGKEKMMLQACSQIIAHNEKMKNFLIEQGVTEEKIHVLELFDYLHDDIESATTAGSQDKKYEICVAGNLAREKSGYLYHLPATLQCRLYGVGYELQKDCKNVEYMGSFNSDKLLKVLRGNFGLVWDGDSAETCSGVYGEYLRYNNPHKTSLYLSCGIPVIIWEQAALAPFILEHQVGFTVSSLYEIEDKIKEMTNEEYQVMRRNALELSEKLKQGYFTKKVFKEILGNA